jgi:heme exporter protein B
MRLRGSDLACVRGGREVFRGLAFIVEAGEALVVTGPNGAGKSSLLRMVAGLVRPRQGQLELEDGDPELSISEHVHYLGHQDALKPSLSVRENLAFCAALLGGGALIGVLFFLVVVTLMPFAIGPDLGLLARMGPAILWLGALLASLLALDRLLATDHEDGSLDLILTARVPLELAVAVKALAHWLTTGLPLVLSSPLLGLLLNLEAKASGAVALTLLAGTPGLTFIGLIGAALTVPLRRGGLLLAILVLPLTIPVLIFGVAASNAAIAGPVPFGAPFGILCALTLISLVIGPIAAAVALRQGLE